jgi:hypothetical protein
MYRVSLVNGDSYVVNSQHVLMLRHKWAYLSEHVDQWQQAQGSYHKFRNSNPLMQ